MIVIPTATSMKLKFPEFIDVADMTIEFAIEEAAIGFTDDDSNGWVSSGSLALMYKSAHLIACGQVALDTFSGGGGGEIASESIGRLSISYKNGSTNSSAVYDDFASSSYGRRYIELRDMNFGGPEII